MGSGESRNGRRSRPRCLVPLWHLIATRELQNRLEDSSERPTGSSLPSETRWCLAWVDSCGRGVTAAMNERVDAGYQDQCEDR